jgi:hypothetical protein
LVDDLSKLHDAARDLYKEKQHALQQEKDTEDLLNKREATPKIDNPS